MVSRQSRARRFQLGFTSIEERGGILRLFQGASLRTSLVTILFAALCIFTLAIGLQRKMGLAEISGIGALTIGGIILAGLYLSKFERSLLDSLPRLLDVFLLVLGLLVVSRLFEKLGWPSVLVPLPLFAALIAAGTSQQTAFVLVLLVTPMVALADGVQRLDDSALPPSTLLDPGLLVTIATGGVVMALSVDRSSSRSGIIAAGALAGAAMAGMTIAADLAFGGTSIIALVRDPWAHLARPLWALLGGVVTGYVAAEFGIRFVEAAFGVLTDIHLDELADLNRPFFKRYNLEAPGTFHHSQVVADFAEEAARAVAANHKLVRVGAYYHDIGKLMHPAYFTENMRGGKSPHDGLTPMMSTLIITAHVKDGMEMARELGLPQVIVDFIPEHHGTQAVEYFYRQALKQEDGRSLPKDAFRYPGPPPRSRETAILMIADTVEAVSRTLEDPTPARIEGLVHNVVMTKVSEGQFDSCPLTMLDLKSIEQSFTRSLIAAHHQRIRYPDEPRPAEKKGPGREGSAAAESPAERAAHPADPQGGGAGPAAQRPGPRPGGPEPPPGPPAEGDEPEGGPAAHPDPSTVLGTGLSAPRLGSGQAGLGAGGAG